MIKGREKGNQLSPDTHPEASVRFPGIASHPRPCLPLALPLFRNPWFLLEFGGSIKSLIPPSPSSSKQLRTWQKEGVEDPSPLSALAAVKLGWITRRHPGPVSALCYRQRAQGALLNCAGRWPRPTSSLLRVYAWGPTGPWLVTQLQVEKQEQET